MDFSYITKVQVFESHTTLSKLSQRNRKSSSFYFTALSKITLFTTVPAKRTNYFWAFNQLRKRSGRPNLIERVVLGLEF